MAVPIATQTDSPSRGLLSFDAAAQYMSCSRRHLDRVVASGELPVIRLGTARRFVVADLDRYIDSLRTARTD
jgi:excisionase family DNA binding protein